MSQSKLPAATPKSRWLNVTMALAPPFTAVSKTMSSSASAKLGRQRNANRTGFATAAQYVQKLRTKCSTWNIIPNVPAGTLGANPPIDSPPPPSYTLAYQKFLGGSLPNVKTLVSSFPDRRICNGQLGASTSTYSHPAKQRHYPTPDRGQPGERKRSVGRRNRRHLHRHHRRRQHLDLWSGAGSGGPAIPRRAGRKTRLLT